jgi:hypothetical protein
MTPTVSEMQHSLDTLLAYQHGRPRQSLEVQHELPRQRWNPDLLSVAELEQFERLAKKAQLPEGDVVDAVFTPEKPK